MKKLLIILLLVLGSLITVGYIQRSQTNKTSLSVTPSASLIIVTQRISTTQTPANFDKITIEANKTALDLLHKTSTIQMQGEGKSAFITSINGRKADPNQKEFWAFYVNGKQASVGAGGYMLHPNDKIEWKIETY